MHSFPDYRGGCIRETRDSPKKRKITATRLFGYFSPILSIHLDMAMKLTIIRKFEYFASYRLSSHAYIDELNVFIPTTDVFEGSCKVPGIQIKKIL